MGSSVGLGVGLSTGLLCGLSVGLGAVLWKSDQQITIKETLQWSWSRKVLIAGLFFGLVAGLGGLRFELGTIEK